jgi:hypothetical protein
VENGNWKIAEYLAAIFWVHSRENIYLKPRTKKELQDWRRKLILGYNLEFDQDSWFKVIGNDI